jgi:hypothetical protein
MSDLAVGQPVSTAPLGNLLRLLSLPLLGFAGFALGLAIVPPDRVALLGASIATAVVVLAPVVYDRTRPPERRHLLFTLVSIAYLFAFALPGLTLYLGTAIYQTDGTFAYIRSLSVADVVRGQVAALVGYVALVAGYYFPLGPGLASVVPRMRREWSHEAVLVTAIVMIPLGWSIIIAGQLGLIPSRAGSGLLSTIGSSANFGIALLALGYQRYRSLPALVLIALLLPPTMIFGFFTGSKLIFLMPLAMVVIASIAVTRQLRLWWFAGALAALVLLYPVSETYRAYKNPLRLTALEVLTNPHHAVGLISRFVDTAKPGEYLVSGVEHTAGRLDMLGIESVIVRDAGRTVPFQHGWSLGYVVIGYVPRLLWPDKPVITIGQWVTDHFGGGPEVTSNTGPSWVGEFYFNFGWWGVIVGMGLLGIWFRFLQEWLLGPDAAIPALLAGVVSIFAIAPSVETGVVTPINSVVLGIMPIAFAHLALRSVTRAPAPAPSARHA